MTWAAIPASTLTLQVPATGNLRVLAFPGGFNLSANTSITDNEGGTWTQESAGTGSTTCTSTTINNQPTITPAGANELVIATMGIGDGLGLGLASGAPSGAIWDLTTYSGDVDLDLMENAEALAHLYTTTASVENWNWNITARSNNSCFSEAVAFK